MVLGQAVWDENLFAESLKEGIELWVVRFVKGWNVLVAVCGATEWSDQRVGLAKTASTASAHGPERVTRRRHDCEELK